MKSIMKKKTDNTKILVGSGEIRILNHCLWKRKIIYNWPFGHMGSTSVDLEYYAILYKAFEHPKILVSMGFLEPIPPVGTNYQL